MDMLVQFAQIYKHQMEFDEKGVIVHLVGPAGSGKSEVFKELSVLMGVNLHIISVSRLSPLEVEGIQFPVQNGKGTELTMLPAAFWQRLKKGDIVLLDEFLRGFPEVYNALLDVFTSRRVGAFKLPKVFIVAASNSVATYDPALEDRLIHIMVPDPRKLKSEREKIASMLVELTGMLPEMAHSTEMEDLITEVVLPPYELLDSFSKRVRSEVPHGKSLRHLIGTTRLRIFKIPQLRELVDANNSLAVRRGLEQYVILTDKKSPVTAERFQQLLASDITGVVRKNCELNLEIVLMRDEMKKRE